MAEFSKSATMKLGGRPVLHCDSRSFAVKSGDSPVYTLEGGLAGFSDGAAEVTISWSQAIPVGGWQINWALLVLNHTTIKPRFEIGGKYFECEGRVMEASAASKVNDPNKVDGSFHGRVTATGDL